MVKKLMADNPSSHMAVVFDARGGSFRNDIYPDYKANRPSMPDDLRSQIEPIRQIIGALGIPLLVIPGVEADDVIGTLAVAAVAEDMDVLISTGDKDLAQLVSERVTLINTMDDSRLDVQGVVDKFGVPPERIVDYLALMGDKSDNIPGVPKVGPKTAVKWLAEYGSLDGVVENAEQIGGKVGESLRASLDTLPLSYRLATIRLDVELGKKVAELTPGEPDREALYQLYAELEFKQWLEELPTESAAPQAEDLPRDYSAITTLEELRAWIGELRQCGEFAVDVETTSLDYMDARLVGISFAAVPGRAAYVPFGHDYDGVPEQLPMAQVLAELGPLLEDSELSKIGQNLKYDMSVLANHGIELSGIRHDTMLESYVLDSIGRHNMDDLAMQHLGLRTIRFEDIAGKGAKQLTFDKVELGAATEYAAEDADITLRLHRTLWPKLEAIPSLREVYEQLELPLIPILSTMERNGVLLDSGLLKEQSEEIAARLEAIEREAYEVAGEEFNLGSPKQLQEILYERLQIPVRKKTPKGQPSTAEAVLQELALDYPLPKLILEHRGLAKLKSTYTDQLPAQVNGGTGRVHTSYHQAVAATGRLSSSDPNLQNIPIRTAEGRRIRKAFVAREEYRLIAADYSQIELRIMAHLSQDAGLLHAFAEALDIHRLTAGEVFGLDAEAVTEDQRRSAKAINFGLIYGMTAFGLGRQLNIPRYEAEAYIERYFERYPGVKAYMDRTRAKAAEDGYVETLFGRRLYLPEINARNFMRRQAAERTAINAPMQGTAADIIKRAMQSVHDWLSAGDLRARMIMQVHDELVIEVHTDDLEAVREGVVERMAGATKLDVPLVVEAGDGADWDTAH